MRGVSATGRVPRAANRDSPLLSRKEGLSLFSGGREALRAPSAGEAFGIGHASAFAFLGEQHRGEIVRDGAAEVIALAEGTAGGADGLDLLDRLEAFGDNVHVERRAHFRHRADDRVALLAGVRAGDEAAIDLDLPERELVDVAERGIAGAEIV